MTESEYYHSKASHDHHLADLVHQEQIAVHIHEYEYKLFSMLKPRVYQDGNMWCVSYGDAPEGIQGFGSTIREAVLDFNKSFVTPINPVKP